MNEFINLIGFEWLLIKNVFADFELMYESIRSHYSLIETGKIIQGFVEDNRANIDKWMEQRRQSKDKEDSLVLSSSREEHPEWFLGSSL